MEVRASLWNNPDAGSHPLPEDPGEVWASIRAAESCMAMFPYLGARFGERGDAFARTDSGYLATLVRFPPDHVIEQVLWLARVLASRGMPRLLMEAHLQVLETELGRAIPSRTGEFAKLGAAQALLRRERQSVIAQQIADRLAAEFARLSANRLPRFGELLVSAVCDEAHGIQAAAPSITRWVDACTVLDRGGRDAASELIGQAREIAGRPRGAS